MWRARLPGPVVASIFLVSLLTVLERLTSSEIFLYTLSPGEILSLLITGGHGGTPVEEWTGLAASLFVNILTYTAIFCGLSALIERFRGRRPGHQAPDLPER
jgi:hypothetical protein